MRLVNTSRWPNHFVRRMLRWCLSESGVESGWLRVAKFRKRECACWSGHGSPSRITVSVGPDHLFPMPWSGYVRACKPLDGSDYFTIADPLEALVAVTAHELGHVAHFNRGHQGRGSEDIADSSARRTLRLFREQRAILETAWSQPPMLIAATPAPSLRDRNAEKARKMLAIWQRKLKIATGKVRKYSKAVRRYNQLSD